MNKKQLLTKLLKEKGYNELLELLPITAVKKDIKSKDIYRCDIYDCYERPSGNKVRIFTLLDNSVCMSIYSNEHTEYSIGGISSYNKMTFSYAIHAKLDFGYLHIWVTRDNNYYYLELNESEVK